MFLIVSLVFFLLSCLLVPFFSSSELCIYKGRALLVADVCSQCMEVAEIKDDG